MKPSKKKYKTTPKTFRITEDIDAMIDVLAETTMRNRTQIIHLAVTEMFRKEFGNDADPMEMLAEYMTQED